MGTLPAAPGHARFKNTGAADDKSFIPTCDGKRVMSAAAPDTDVAPRPSWPRRLHSALMPDYNRKATVYWWAVLAAGVAVLVGALVDLSSRPAEVWLQLGAGIAIAMVAGVFPVRMPQSKISFAAGEIFIFLLLLMFGPAAATLASAGEAAVGSYRTSKRWTSRIISPAMAALAMMITGSLLQATLDTLVARGAVNAGYVVAAMMVFSLSYFFFNTLLVSAVPRLKRNESLVVADLFGVFGWVGIVYSGSACVATLLHMTYLSQGIGVLMATVPLLAMLLSTLHYFFRQQEAAEAVRAAGAEASERERELAARHVRELEASERRFQSAFTHASIGMALLSFEGRILLANPALCDLLGWPGDTLTQQSFQDVLVESYRHTLDEHLGLISGKEFEGFALELQCRHRSGDPVWVATHCSFFSEPGASTPCLILQVQDITARRMAEEGLHHIAFHDALTGLPNRRRFHELLADAVERALHDDKEAFAVMFIDFDRFKLINDSLGHSAGDEFLVLVSQRIQQCLRPSDIVARLGGDEFAILANQLGHERNALNLADRLIEALRRPFQVAGTDLTTSASIGITFSALGYTSPGDVLRDADIAMYKAKSAGKARYALFDASLHTEVANRLRLEGDLRRAVDDGSLTVVYQPLFEIAGGRIAGFEALLRWRHPEHGAISPAEFLPIAEEAGLMVRLTDFVLHCACRQLRAWQSLGPAQGELTMNVNLSGHDLAHPALVARVTQALVEAGVQAEHLCLELTENVLMSRVEGAVPLLGELKALGVKLAIDDFGTGYSSLSHLSTLPIDCLKIDRSFVMRLNPGTQEAAVVRSIVVLGSTLGKVVVAEGIETAAQLEQLREIGCHHGQGYLLARPAAAADLAPLLGRAKMPAAALPPRPDQPALLH